MRYWDKWTRERFVARRPCSGRPRHTNNSETRLIIQQNIHTPTVSLCPIHTLRALTLQSCVSFHTIPRCLAKGQLLSYSCSLRILPQAPNHHHLCLDWCRTQRDWTVIFFFFCNRESSSATKSDSIRAVTAFLNESLNLFVNVLILPSLYSGASLTTIGVIV
ncbi:hypothetical protein TNCV_2795301 [Trichonephila clavipes]|nr:hypothetical protein TNCV_2795301 [Trichonephila clavipes]